MKVYISINTIFQNLWLLSRFPWQRKESTKLGFLVAKLKSSLRKYYRLHHDLVYRYGIFMSQMTINIFLCRNYNPTLSLFMIQDLIFDKSSTSGTRSAYPS